MDELRFKAHLKHILFLVTCRGRKLPGGSTWQDPEIKRLKVSSGGSLEGPGLMPDVLFLQAQIVVHCYKHPSSTPLYSII